jgi:Tfp pilus assembly protein PilF
MKKPRAAGFALALSILSLYGGVAGQEDISRDNRLPSRIGGRACTNNARATATVAGSLNVTGVAAGTNPKFAVSLFSGGAFISRQRVKNGGSYIFYCVPPENATLVAEADGIEIGTVQMGPLNSPPLANRQDLIVAIGGSGTPDRKDVNAVISARYAYDRSRANQQLFDRATDDIRNGKAETAAKHLEKIVATDPADFVAWLYLGDIHFNAGRFAEAENAYETSLKLKPDVAAKLGVGRSALKTKNLTRSIEVLSSAHSDDPDSADVNHYLGEAYLQDRKGSLAIEHFNLAIEKDPQKKADLHLRMAALYHAAKAPHLAANEYKLFLEKRPDHPDRAKMENYIREHAQ